jgi:superfamily II DNA or RNA helicase
MTGESLDRAIAVTEAELADLDMRRAAVVERLAALNENRRASRTPVSDGDRSPVGWSAVEKVELFGSLFRGREDVFAVRWENASTRRSGYAPRCVNEWKPAVCEKPRVRCGACPNQAFMILNSAEVRGHLQGRQVVGIYPLLADETCWLLAIDLDGESWPADVAALRRAAARIGVLPAVERSRSGEGAHLWFFFASPVSATEARELGELLLTHAMADSPSLGMDSYDRLFPSQGTMPTGGFGNLIALPLQHAARQNGNSLFVDERCEPYVDQWAFLDSLPRISPDLLARVLAEARVTGDLLAVAEPQSDARAPWKPAQPLATRLAGIDLPAAVSATLAERLYVERATLPAPLLDAIRRLAVFANPVFAERQAMRLSTGLTPRVIACFEDLAHHLALPRGCLNDLNSLLEKLGIGLLLTDERSEGTAVAAAFTGTLTLPQERAVAELAAEDIGVLCAPPGAGKTVMGVKLIALRGRSTLILVHRKPLVEQWVARLREFLDVDPQSIGTVGGGRSKPSGVIDVATVQGLARAAPDPETLGRYGHVIVDECHHVPAVSIERLLGSCPARYVTGLTATPYRRDGHQPIIPMQCGPTRHVMSSSSVALGALRVVRRDTRFDPSGLPPDPGIQEVYSALAADSERIELVAADTLALLAEGRAPIVLTERRDHLERLVERLIEHVPGLVTLHGDVTPRRRREALARLSRLAADEPHLVLATGRFIGEGFDDPRLDTLLLAMPIAWKGTVVQYAGRLHRPHPAKSDARIYDYVDVNIPVLRRMFAKRVRTYRAMGYTISDDASFVGLQHSPDTWQEAAEQANRVRGRPIAVSTHSHADERTRTST